MTQFLVYGDLHVHPYRDFAVPNKHGINSRLVDCIGVLDSIIAYLKVHKDIKLVIDLGDTIQAKTSVDVIAYSLLHEKMATMSGLAEIKMLVGNHNFVLRNDTAINGVAPLSSLCEVIHIPQWTKIDNILFTFMPWQIGDHKCPSILPGAKDMFKILCAHTGIDGAVTGPSDFVLRNPIKREAFEQFDFVLAGHYHKAQMLGSKILYVGSPLQLNWGERNDGDKGFWHITVENDIDMRFVPLVNPRFMHLHIDEMPNGKQLQQYVTNLQRDFVHVHTTKSVRQQLMALGDVWENAIYIVKPEQERVSTKTTVKPTMTIDEMGQHYIQQVAGVLNQDLLRAQWQQICERAT